MKYIITLSQLYFALRISFVLVWKIHPANSDCLHQIHSNFLDLNTFLLHHLKHIAINNSSNEPLRISLKNLRIQSKFGILTKLSFTACGYTKNEIFMNHLFSKCGHITAVLNPF